MLNLNAHRTPKVVTRIEYKEGLVVLFSKDQVVYTEIVDEKEMVEDILCELQEESLITIPD